MADKPRQRCVHHMFKWPSYAPFLLTKSLSKNVRIPLLCQPVPKRSPSGHPHSRKLIKENKIPRTRRILGFQVTGTQVSAAKLLATETGLLSATDSDWASAVSATCVGSDTPNAHPAAHATNLLAMPFPRLES